MSDALDRYRVRQAVRQGEAPDEEDFGHAEILGEEILGALEILGKSLQQQKSTLVVKGASQVILVYRNSKGGPVSKTLGPVGNLKISGSFTRTCDQQKCTVMVPGAQQTTQTSLLAVSCDGKLSTLPIIAVLYVGGQTAQLPWDGVSNPAAHGVQQAAPTSRSAAPAKSWWGKLFS